MRPLFIFSACITTWPQMTFDLGIWPLTTWTYEDSHIISINQLQVWFQSNFNFSNEANFTYSAYLITWPQMTFAGLSSTCNYVDMSSTWEKHADVDTKNISQHTSTCYSNQTVLWNTCETKKNNVKFFKRYDYCSILPPIFRFVLYPGPFFVLWILMSHFNHLTQK